VCCCGGNGGLGDLAWLGLDSDEEEEEVDEPENGPLFDTFVRSLPADKVADSVEFRSLEAKSTEMGFSVGFSLVGDNGLDRFVLGEDGGLDVRWSLDLRMSVEEG